MLPLIVRPAHSRIDRCGAGISGIPDVGWAPVLHSRFCGRHFGVLGGYLTDMFGRRRVLTFSILLYAVSAFLSRISPLRWRCCWFSAALCSSAFAWNSSQPLHGWRSFSRSRAARARHRLHAGVLVVRRLSGGTANGLCASPMPPAFRQLQRFRSADRGSRMRHGGIRLMTGRDSRRFR